MKFNWQQTSLIVLAVVGIAAFLVRSLLTGEDIPQNFQILFGAIIGLALGGAAIPALRKKDREDGGE